MRPNQPAPTRRGRPGMTPGAKPKVQPIPRRGTVFGLRMPQKPAVWLLVGGGVFALLIFGTILAAAFGILLVLGSGNILPGVSAAGVPLGGKSVNDAAAALVAHWQNVHVRDGERVWQIPAGQLGILIDAQATAQNAQRYGRGDGSVLTGLLGKVAVRPVINVDPSRAAAGLVALAPMVDLAPRNATIRVENGQIVPVASEVGRKMDTSATLVRLADPGTEFADGALDLVMTPVAPSITDPGLLVAQYGALLTSPLTINAFNAVTAETLPWSIPPQMWGQWLVSENTAQGVALSLESHSLADFFEQRNQELGGPRFIKVEEAVRATQAALAARQATTFVRVYNAPTRYTVQPGDTLGTVAWKTGIQMFRISAANGGIQSLSAGQVIALPSKDDLIPLPINFTKRIVVSISRQRMWVYENGQAKWEWAASTGISDSPTQPGVYQVTSHDGTAYASVWNLYMPNFMSIYEAVPGFYNGIHGFPWRNGSQILWENALGRQVTYGCVLISSANAKALYEWAEDGVVVEIQG